MSVPAVGIAPIVRARLFGFLRRLILTARRAAGLWRCCSRPSSVYGLGRWLSQLELTLYLVITALSKKYSVLYSRTERVEMLNNTIIYHGDSLISPQRYELNAYHASI